MKLPRGYVVIRAAHMRHDAVEIDDRPNRIDLTSTSSRHLRVNIRRDLRDQRGRGLDSIEFLQDLLDVARGHSLAYWARIVSAKPRMGINSGIIFDAAQRVMDDSSVSFNPVTLLLA